MPDTAATALSGGCVPGADEVAHWVAALPQTASDAERVERIQVLEELKARAAAAQARLSADLDASQRARQSEVRLPAAQQGRGVASQVAAARRESPVRGAQHLGLAKALVAEMPHTLAALTSGALSEWRATLLVRETACLTREDRARVDERLCADPDRLEGWGDRRLVAEARKLAYALDPVSVVRRTAKAVSERRVSIRPAPDTMAQVSALLPAAQGIAVWATLSRVADTLTAQGDERSRGQIMADTLVERVTGQTKATAVPVAVNVTISDAALLAGDATPAWLEGHGPLPAQTARGLVATAVEQAHASLRRLYACPETGQLAAMESQAGAFPKNLRHFLDLRDQTCRTPWCDAPVRHHDHVRSRHAGGPTTVINGQGLCEQCNHAKQAPGWSARAVLDDLDTSTHTVETTTPTGQVLRSRSPGLPPPTPLHPRAKLDLRFEHHYVLAV